MKTCFFLKVNAVIVACSALSTLAQVQLQPLWNVAPGVRPYLTTGNTERGLAYNPVTGHVLVSSRAGGNLTLAILDGTTGADLGTMSMTGVETGAAAAVGTFPFSMIGVARDGAIYAGNLAIDATQDFRLYRWDNEGDSTASLVYKGRPIAGGSERWGDTLAVRGEGNGTQILVASRNHSVAALFLTGDQGATFQPYAITTDAPAGDFGLGIAYGAGNDFWGTASGRTLRHFGVDPATQAATTVGNYGAADGVPTAVAFIGVEPTLELLAGVELIGPANNVEQPDNLLFYSVQGGYPILLDSETLLPSGPNPNINGTGAISFGGGKLFVLESNNGVHAYDLIPEPRGSLLFGLGLAVLLARRTRRRA